MHWAGMVTRRGRQRRSLGPGGRRIRRSACARSCSTGRRQRARVPTPSRAGCSWKPGASPLPSPVPTVASVTANCWRSGRSFGALEPEIANGPLRDLRKNDVVTRDADFIKTPSALFRHLLADKRDTGSAWAYYEAALGIGHAMCALADVPTRDCLAALDAYRQLLLDELRSEGGTRPTPAAVATDPASIGGLPGEPPAAAPDPRRAARRARGAHRSRPTSSARCACS